MVPPGFQAAELRSIATDRLPLALARRCLACKRSGFKRETGLVQRVHAFVDGAGNASIDRIFVGVPIERLELLEQCKRRIAGAPMIAVEESKRKANGRR